MEQAVVFCPKIACVIEYRCTVCWNKSSRPYFVPVSVRPVLISERTDRTAAKHWWGVINIYILIVCSNKTIDSNLASTCTGACPKAVAWIGLKCICTFEDCGKNCAFQKKKLICHNEHNLNYISNEKNLCAFNRLISNIIIKTINKKYLKKGLSHNLSAWTVNFRLNAPKIKTVQFIQKIVSALSLQTALAAPHHDTGRNNAIYHF